MPRFEADRGGADGCNVGSFVAPVCPVAGIQVLLSALTRPLVLLEGFLHLIPIHLQTCHIADMLQREGVRLV